MFIGTSIEGSYLQPRNDLNKVIHKKELSPDEIIQHQDFNKEVDDLMDSLKKSSDEKEKLLQQIKSGDIKDEINEEKSKTGEEATGEKPELSEWEKRLEGIS